MSNNSNGIDILWWFLGLLALIFVVYFIIKAIDALTKPSVVWFILGIIATLVIEGLIFAIRAVVRFFKRRNNTHDTTSDDE